MPGTLTTTYGNRANARQLELRKSLQLYRHFFYRHPFWCGEFVLSVQKSRTRSDFSSENDMWRRSRNVYKYFLDGKILEPRKTQRENISEKYFANENPARIFRGENGGGGELGI